MEDNLRKNKDFYSTTEAASVLGVSRIALFKKIKNGQIKAERVGRSYFIARKDIFEAAGKVLSDNRRLQIEKSVDKTIEDYGEVLKRLGKE